MRKPANIRRPAAGSISGSSESGVGARPATLAPQRGDIGGVASFVPLEYRCARDERIGAGRDGPARGLRRDAAIDFERDVAAGLGDKLGRRFDLLELAFDEALAAEARV